MLETPPHLTVGDIARMFDVPKWKVRRIVDGLDVEIPRVGMYRLIPRDLLTEIAVRLKSRVSTSAAELTRPC